MTYVTGPLWTNASIFMLVDSGKHKWKRSSHDSGERKYLSVQGVLCGWLPMMPLAWFNLACQKCFPKFFFFFCCLTCYHCLGLFKMLPLFFWLVINATTVACLLVKECYHWFIRNAATFWAYYRCYHCSGTFGMFTLFWLGRRVTFVMTR